MRNCIQKKKLHLFLMCSILCFSFLINVKSVFAAQKITYYLEVNEEIWNSLNVIITIEDNLNNNLYVALPDFSYLTNFSNNYYNDISDFKVLGEYGQELAFDKIKTNAWSVQTEKNRTIVISYKINRTSDDILGLCLNKKFARIDNRITFMYVRELINSPINVVIRVPHSWKLATELRPSLETFEYIAINYDDLIEKSIYMSPFQEYFFPLENRSFFVIIDGSQAFKVGRLIVLTKNIVKNHIKLFKDIPFNQYFFIFKIINNGSSISSKNYENSSIFYLPLSMARENLEQIAEEISTTFFQHWNGIRFSNSHLSFTPDMKNMFENLWFQAGISNYYGCLSLVRAGIWTEKSYINHQIAAINKLNNHPLCNDSLRTEVQYGWDIADYYELTKLKGHILGMLIDLEIRKQTQNQKSLDDVLFFLDRWFGSRQMGYDNAALLLSLNAVSTANLTPFFDTFFQNNKPLPFKEYLELAGIFLKTEIDTLPDLGYINLSDIDSKVVKLNKNSILAHAGLNINDQIISINSRQIQDQSSLNNFIESLEVGQEIDISIKRDNLPLMLTAIVPGKSREVISIVSDVPQSVDQQVLRKTWLSHPVTTESEKTVPNQ